jgi:tRNA pseudouridine38-40 synthase
MDEQHYNYKLLIMYEGTSFHGWQVQPNGMSVQQKLQDAIFLITKEKVSVVGSGRTDAGVHALGQVAHFKISKELNLYRFQHSLNALVRPDICVKEVASVPLDFHAQYSAKRKTYNYNVCLTRYQNPFNQRYSWHFVESADVGLLKAAAKSFVGTHDFTSFANEAYAGSASKDPVRTLYRLDVRETAEGIILEFEGDGFLYKMVRNIVGTLLDIAAGKLPSDCIPALLAAKDRRRAGTAAPPHGLFLVKVDYPV